MLDGLRDHLRDRRILLVLDNFEQVLSAAPVVAELLARCPHLKVLVTSRAVLHLQGEHEYAVPPLALPDPTNPVSSESLAQYGALSLFIQRARESKRDFEPTGEHLPAIAEICRRLDGLPLAIELAAARIKVLSPEALLRRMERRLPLLTGGARDLPARQRTLRDAIAWSYDLLSEAEQRVFRRLGTFVGGFTLESAEAVCESDDSPFVDLLDCISSLVDQILLRQLDEGPSHEPRFGMLETIREYALEQLDLSDESDLARSRHAAFFVELAEAADAGLRTADQSAWLTRTELEHGNLRAALAWSHARADGAERALRLAGALAWFWYVHGHFSEDRPWLDRTLEQREGCSPAARGKALAGAGLLALRQADYDQAASLLEEGLALCRAVGDTWGIGWCFSLTAMVARERGQYESATQQFEESARLFREVGDLWGLGWTLGSHGIMATRLGDYERAVTLHEESSEAYRQSGNTLLLARGMVARVRAEHGRGNHERAEALLNEGLSLLRDLGDSWAVAQALDGLGRVAVARQASARARALHQEALSLYRDLGHKTAITGCLEEIASVMASLGQGRRAACLLAAAEAARRAIGVGPTPPQQALRQRVDSRTREQIGNREFEAATAEGWAMSLEEAVAYALDESAGGRSEQPATDL